jgi:vanillate O-demethylase ferredoxin subunit
MVEASTQRAYLHAVTYLARDACAFDFRPVEGGAFAPFTAGAHVDLLLPNGVRRAYSLSNSQSETHRYVVGVKRAEQSRSASAYLHDHLRVGTEIAIAAPRNHFPLAEQAAHSVLIAGGIGVTPILSMARRLAALGASYEIHYACRTRADAAFLDDLRATAPRLHVTFDHEPGARMLDLVWLVAEAQAGAHFYACGPAPMLDAFEAAARGLERERVHVERFTNNVAPALAREAGFEIELARSQRRLRVPHGKAILDVLLDEGVEIAFSCMDGVCGSCKVGVIDGLPDHHDAVLSAEERAAGKTMMVCCSGAKSDRLVLDL